MDQKSFIRFLLSEPEANSRFVFLLQGAAVALSTVVLVFGFIIQDPHNREGYTTAMMTMLGGGSLATISRGVYKGVGAKAGSTTGDTNNVDIQINK